MSASITMANRHPQNLAKAITQAKEKPPCKHSWQQQKLDTWVGPIFNGYKCRKCGSKTYIILPDRM